MDALREVAETGWTEEARLFASSTLLALSKAPVNMVESITTMRKSAGHIMISYSWVHQAIMKRLVDSLKQKGFSTWFDLDDMKGNIVLLRSTCFFTLPPILSRVNMMMRNNINSVCPLISADM